MKKIFFLAVLFIGTAAFAQDTSKDKSRMTPDERINKRVELFSKELDLTNDQQEKLRELFEKQAQDRETSKQQTQSLKEERRENFDKELRDMLTPEQIQKLDEKKKERREKMKAHPHGTKDGKKINKAEKHERTKQHKIDKMK